MKRNIVCAVILTIALGGCSIFSSDTPSGPPRKFSETVSPRDEITIKKVTVPEEKLKRAILRSRSLPQVRFVPVYRKKMDTEYKGIPEYRIFQIHSESSFALLGIEKGDLLLAVLDTVVSSPDKLPLFPEGLLLDKKSSMVIERKGELVRFDFKVEEASSSHR